MYEKDEIRETSRAKSSNGEVGPLLQEDKNEDRFSWQTEYKTFRSNLTKKFKPRKRKMGNLILISDINYPDELTSLDCETAGECSKRTFGGTISGILSRLFCSKNMSHVASDGYETLEKVPSRSQESHDDQRIPGNKLIRLFGSYKERNIVSTQQIDGYYNNNVDREFNRFSKLEDALDAKVDTKLLNEESIHSMNFSTAAKNSTGGDSNESSKSFNTSQEAIDNQSKSNVSPKSESEKLENIVFSPYTHRPSLRDIPGIENATENSEGLKEGYSIGLIRIGNKGRISKKNDGFSKSSGDQKFKSLDEEIDSHLYSQSQCSLISKCLGHKYKQIQQNSSETQIKNNDFTSKLQPQPVPTSPTNLSESLTVIKGILKHKYKSNFSRDKQKRQDICVRFVSPTLSTIEMTNKDENLENNSNSFKESSLPIRENEMKK